MSLTVTRRYNVDRFGYLIPHRYGNLPMLGAVATFRPGEGRFGRGAVAVEEGTTNLWTNPGWLDGTLSGWGNVSRDGSTGIREVVRDERFGYALRLAKTDSGDGRWGVYQNKTWHQTGSVIADSVYVKVISASNEARVQCYSDYSNSEGSSYYGRGWGLNLNTFELSLGQGGTARHTPVGDGWYRIEFVTAEGDIVGGISYYWIDRAPAEVLLAYPQKEAKPFATSFVDGTRTTGGLEYPGSVLPLDEATLICWVKAHEGSPDQRRDIWAINSGVSSDDRLVLGRNITRSGWGFYFRLVGGSSSELRHNVPLDFGWHMIGFRYRYNASSDRYDLALIFDGDIVATGTSINAGMLKNIYRLYSDGGSYAANCLIDELLILPYAASEEEIASWYEAQGLLPPHPQASLQWDRQTVRPAQMVKL